MVWQTVMSGGEDYYSMDGFEQVTLSSCEPLDSLFCSEQITQDSSGSLEENSEELAFLSESSKFKRKREKSTDRETTCERSAKRRSLLRTASVLADSIPMCSKLGKGDVKPIATSKNFATSLIIDSIEVPQSSSLFNPFTVMFTLRSPTKDFQLSKSNFRQIPNPSSQNGIWLKLNANQREREVFLLIELYEKRLNSEQPFEQLVQFCQSGACGKKKESVVELRDKKLQSLAGDDKETVKFEPLFAINEQCAHRSQNEYGSPNTRFFFKFQLCEKVVENTQAKTLPISHTFSSLIKVVAPGKNKDLSTKVVSIAKKSGGKAKKVTVKQMLETVLRKMQTFEDRLKCVEEKLEQQSFREQIPFPFMDPALSLRLSGSLGMGSFLPSPQAEHAAKQEILPDITDDMHCLAGFLNSSQ